MHERFPPARPGAPIAIVGIACRFPDAADPGQFLDLVVNGRRAFRRIPPGRLDGPVAGPARAGLIEGWRFDLAAFGVTEAAYRAADPAQWLALETAARALADGGFPGGQGLTRDRTGVMIGNTLAGDVSRTAAMRGRWPFVRRVLSSALSAAEIPPEARTGVIERAAEGFLSTLPPLTDGSLAGGMPSAIADRICGHFGFRGGGHAVDSAHSSSLLAVAAACSALAAGDLDAAIAGGVDVSMDPFELAGLSRAGVLAESEMRVFDSRPTGFWPGEGCGLVLLMRAADARKANVPVYAEIAGWGISSAGSAALTTPGSGSLLLALRRAYQRARVEPADVQLIEGDGTGTASGDLAELTSLAEIRSGAPGLAALTSVKANIGHTRAAAGAAGLIKAALATAAGVIPPATGCARPHMLIASQEARVRAPREAEIWPEGARLAGVSAIGPGGTSVHLVLRREPHGGRRRRAPSIVKPADAVKPADPRATPAASAARPSRGARHAAAPPRGDGAPPPLAGGGAAAATPATASPARARAYLFSAADRVSLVRELSRLADVAPWLSDSELHDLAHSSVLQSQTPGLVRVSLVAAGQEQLAARACDAAGMAATLRPGKLVTSPGIFAADGPRGRVALLFPGEGALSASPRSWAPSGDDGRYEPALQPSILATSLASLRWLRRFGVGASVAVGHGLGEITGLVWAGCLSEHDAARLVSQRAELLGAPCEEPSAMVSVDLDEEAARRLCAGADLVVCADNGPRCQVLAGPVRAVRELLRRLGEQAVPARVLDAPHGFYSPAMADRIPPLRSILGEFTFHPPARRLISTITGAELSTRDDLVTLLCAQLTSPVRFAGPLRRAAAEADLLVEAGPGESLSSLAADCCDVPAVSLAAARADDGAQARAVAALFAVGAIRSIAPLLAGQAARPIDIWRERTFITNPCGSPPPPGLRAAEGAGQPKARFPARTSPAVQATPRPPGGVPRAPETGSPARAGARAPQDVAEAEPAGWPVEGQPASARAPAHPVGGQPVREAPATPASADQARAGHTSPPQTVQPVGRQATHTQTSQPQTSQPQTTQPQTTQPQTTQRHGPRGQTPEVQQPMEHAGAVPEPTKRAGAVREPSRHSLIPAPGPESRTADRPRAGRRSSPPARPAPRGVAPWVRVFTEQVRRAPAPDPSHPAGPWRLHLASRQPFGHIAADLFPSGRAADCVLAIVADPQEADGCAILLEAARAAVGTGRLVVISAVPGLAGFCASLRAEHPSLGVTVIQTPENAAGLRAARPFATAVPGEFREIRIDEAGIAREVVNAPVEPAADGPFPLGPADVVLVSGVTRLGDLACAASLSSRGAALAVIAPPGPPDPALAAYLADLRAAGIRVSRKKADPSDPGQIAAAVRSLERGLGPITAIVYAAAPGTIERCVKLPEATLRNQLLAQRARLANVLSAVAMERVRLLLTFGSVSGRHGRPLGASGALLSGLLPTQAARLGSGWARCRVVHVDWPEWVAQGSEAARAEALPAAARRPGIPGRPVPRAGGPLAEAPRWEADPILIANGWRLLHSVLASPDFAGRAAIHGRVGTPGPPMAGRPWTGAGHGRFLERIRVHYPGIELIADARLSLPSDPYLADHRIDGLPVLPAAMALEAMAQAAAAVAGEPLRHASGVAMPAPVVLPADGGGESAVIRVCALRGDDGVETVLRCAETGFRVDHARALFRPRPASEAGSRPGLPHAGPAGSDAAPSAIVDGTDLYGPVLFQAGRFRRVAFLPEVSSRRCRALVRGSDDQPWFGAAAGREDAPLILGSPGLNDATLHMLQACLPHRRVLVAGCESVSFSGREVRGALQVRATRRSGGAEPGAGVWDVRALDATGQPIIVWRGVHLRAVGPLPQSGAWHPALLAVSLEARAAELGLDTSLRAAIRCGRPFPGRTRDPGEARDVGGSGGRGDDARRGAPAEWADTAPGRGRLDGFELTVEGSGPLACAWEAVGPAAEFARPHDVAAARLHQQLSLRSDEPQPAVAARLHAVLACLSALGREPGDPLALEDACDGGWIVVRAARAVAACCLTEITGVAAPVAVAIARDFSSDRRGGEPPTAPPGREPAPPSPVGAC